MIGITMKTVVITRKYWSTGRLRWFVDGKQCCLGFCARSFGVPAKDLLGYAAPANLSPKNRVRFPDWMLEQTPGHVSDVETAMKINDSDISVIPMEEKETLLKDLFLKHDIKLVFRGQP
jgi:hypothetical protein